ncbi:MAG: hypothetical protein JWM31_1913 [Solirubrobacterales bacterium]|nr:hypothetical protein [Solirubrobacterales bacterium]
MDEVIDGVLHWATYHEGIGQTVHSHMHLASGAIFDPLLPEGGAEALGAAGLPSVVLLSNRHHLRHAAVLAETYGIPIRCHEAGLHAFTGAGAPDVEAFAFGDEVAPGVRATGLGALTPEETVFRIDAGPGALLFADGLIRRDGELMFVPDQLLGEDPETVKRELRSGLTRLLGGDQFDTLLFAHGEPLRAGGRQALEAFLS